MSISRIDISGLFDKYHDKIYRLALSISKNENDAEDIVQNTFLRIAEGRAPFRSLSSLSTWIYKIAHNEALMYLRKKQSDRRLSEVLKTTPGGLFINWPKVPDREAVGNELRERMDGILSSLPLRYRMPILLHKVEGLPDREAAAIMKIKINTFKTRLRRAVMAVADALSDYYKGRRPKIGAQKPRCPLYTGFVYRYAAEELDPKKRLSFKRHIADCPSCKSFLNTYGLAIRITKAVECSDMPAGLKEKLKTFFHRRNN